VDRETAVARTLVKDAPTAIQQEQKDMTNADKAGLTTTNPETTFQEILNAIAKCLRDLAISDDGEEGEGEDDDEKDPELGNLSNNDEPGWVMGTISKTLQHQMKLFRQKQMNLDQLMQPGSRDTADYFCERDKK